MSFSMTKEAKARIKEILDKEEDINYVRIKVLSGGCSGFHYDVSLATDFNIKEDERFPVDDHDFSIGLIIDKKSFVFLNETTLDYSGNITAKSFKFLNPKASRTCGCGESFSA